MKEIWKNIPNYEGLYQVSNLGNIRSLNYNHTGMPKNLSLKSHHSGYKTVMLCKDGTKKNRTVHNLVAISFLKNPENKPQVNHKDGNKSNNNVSNLEWSTRSENVRHAIKNNLRPDSYLRDVKGKFHPSSKPVFQYDKSGNFIKKWDCISDAARYFHCSVCSITSCCAGRIRTCKGYIWKRE